MPNSEKFWHSSTATQKITNDPKSYAKETGNPHYIIDLSKRIVTISVETSMIVLNLLALDIAE